MSRAVPDIAFCRIGEDLVLLETVTGQYFCLPGAAIDDLDAETLAQIAPSVPTPSLAQGPALTAERDIDDFVASASGGRAAFLLSAATAYFRYPSQSFGRLVREAQRRKRTNRSRDFGAVAATCLSFRGRLPYAPRRGECFFRSFVLLDLLARQGLEADWVIAVKTWPFAAHCWLQLDGVVLDDEVDRVVGFTPILVV